MCISFESRGQTVIADADKRKAMGVANRAMKRLAPTKRGYIASLCFSWKGRDPGKRVSLLPLSARLSPHAHFCLYVRLRGLVVGLFTTTAKMVRRACTDKI